MEQSPMQKLINGWKDELKSIEKKAWKNSPLYSYKRSFLSQQITHARSLLEQEKKVIEDAFIAGDGALTEIAELKTLATDYYNQTYQPSK